MTATVLTIAAAYVVLGVLLLTMGLSSRFAWWVKAAAIIITSVFFVEAFFAIRGILGWPRSGPLPARFQLLWVRVVEPDLKASNPGAIYLWLEAVDENNIPDGIPLSYRLAYSRPLADRAIKARDEIISGKPQQGVAEEPDGNRNEKEGDPAQPRSGTKAEPGLTTLDLDQLQLLQQAQRVEFGSMPVPILPPKVP